MWKACLVTAIVGTAALFSTPSKADAQFGVYVGRNGGVAVTTGRPYYGGYYGSGYYGSGYYGNRGYYSSYSYPNYGYSTPFYGGYYSGYSYPYYGSGYGYGYGSYPYYGGGRGVVIGSRGGAVYGPNGAIVWR